MTGNFCPQTLTFDPIAIHLPVIMGDVEKKEDFDNLIRKENGRENDKTEKEEFHPR